MKKRFKEKVAIITGAARGMGKAVAERFVEEGAYVALLDIKLSDLEKLEETIAKKAEVLSLEVDVSNKASVTEAFKKIIEKWDKVDILVNNAGIIAPTSIGEITEEEWDRMLDVNLKGVFLCSQQAFLYMKENENGGSIINNASSAAKRTSTLGGAHYTASKTGILGLTRHFAREAGPYGVRVNAICPGIIMTEMVLSNTDTEQRETIANKLPLKRIGDPEEIADLVTYLASEESSYITGADVNIGGGELVLP